MTKIDVIVIGNGAAGAFASIIAARSGKKVIVIEKMAASMKKLSITGKGRCNLTNNCDSDTFLKNVRRNPKFLYSAISAFPTLKTMEFFENLGVPLKTERGNRVFPVSDKAEDIVNALKNEQERLCVKTLHDEALEIISEDKTAVGVKTKNNTIYGEKIILATGGLSYPKTGSTGDGYRFAEKLGHKVITPKPSLVPLVTKENLSLLSGLSMKNTTLSLYDSHSKKKEKPIFSEQGEFLFTHFGLSGPLVLSMSSYIEGDFSGDRYKVKLDMKPALSAEKLDLRLLREINESKNKEYKNLLRRLMPHSMVDYFINLTEIDPEKQANVITKEERKRIIYCLKNIEFTLEDFYSIDAAVITDGGVDVKEIDPKTMKSKIINGLYFAGEVIDVAGFTGGFNLQIAFSTAYLAANN